MRNQRLLFTLFSGIVPDVFEVPASTCSWASACQRVLKRQAVARACEDLIEDGLKVAHGLHEAVALDGHDDVDRVEVALAPEAAGEVGVGVDGRVEVMAQRAHEAEAAVMGFVEQFEDLGDQRDDHPG